VNTDQAFGLLIDAGLTESNGIETVRRWLREGKIKYEGNGSRKAGYILQDTDQAFELLKDAGVSRSNSIDTVRRWMQEGKIKYDRTDKKVTEYIIEDTASTLFKSEHNHQSMNELIHQMRLKIKAQNKRIEGIEEIYETEKNIWMEQRGRLKKEAALLKNENKELQRKIEELMEQNIRLRDELAKFKNTKREKEDNRSHSSYHFTVQSNDYRHKLGISKRADKKEVVAAYKELLKISHTDFGGNAKLFHYIQTDYNHFRNNID